MDRRLPTERIAIAAYWLASGHGFTVSELADRLGTTPRGTRRMLEKLSSALPLIEDFQDDRRGAVWRLLPDDD